MDSRTGMAKGFGQRSGDTDCRAGKRTRTETQAWAFKTAHLDILTYIWISDLNNADADCMLGEVVASSYCSSLEDGLTMAVLAWKHFFVIDGNTKSTTKKFFL